MDTKMTIPGLCIIYTPFTLVGKAFFFKGLNPVGYNIDSLNVFTVKNTVITRMVTVHVKYSFNNCIKKWSLF